VRKPEEAEVARFEEQQHFVVGGGSHLGAQSAPDLRP
jgi:hypothetical protein